MRVNHVYILSILALFATILMACTPEESNYDPHRRKVLFERYQNGVLGAALSPEGFYAVIGRHKAKYPVLWDLVQQKEMYEVKDELTQGAYLYKFTRDSKYVAMAGENRVSIWHVETGKKYGGFRVSDPVTAIDVNSDGVYTMLGTLDGAIYYIHSSSGRVIRHMLGRHKVESVALSPNNLYMASADANKTVRVWRMANGKVAHTIKMRKAVKKVLLSNQNLVILTSQGGMYLYSIVTGRMLHKLDYPNTSVSDAIISNSSKYLVTSNLPDKINIWKMRTGEFVQSLHVKSLSRASTGQRYVLAVAFNEHDKEIFIEDAGGHGEIFAVTSLMSELEKKHFESKSYINPSLLPGPKAKTKEEKLRKITR